MVAQFEEAPPSVAPHQLQVPASDGFPAQAKFSIFPGLRDVSQKELINPVLYTLCGSLFITLPLSLLPVFKAPRLSRGKGSFSFSWVLLSREPA